MSIFSASGNISSGSISARAVTLATSLRDNLQEIQNLQQFISAQSDSDLVALGFSATDLSFLRSAVADANAIAQIFFTGLPPGTYPQPASAYVYAASQRQIIGPR